MGEVMKLFFFLLLFCVCVCVCVCVLSFFLSTLFKLYRGGEGMVKTGFKQ